MTDFDGQVVLITGAGRGLGRALAQAFSSRGAIVAANDLTPTNLDITAAMIQNSGGRVKEYLYDVAMQQQAAAMIDEVIQDWGRLDVLVNNAAVAPRIPVIELDEWDWNRTLGVNLSGPFFLIQAVRPVMLRQNGGVILNIGAVMTDRTSRAGRAAYWASKAGLVELGRSAAEELAFDRIRVNTLCPGDLETSLDRTIEQILYLASPAAETISGQVFDLS
jgi:NAD(P)-dependent dehydrogenase (short-subunit alcohol dehydrogenase family)